MYSAVYYKLRADAITDNSSVFRQNHQNTPPDDIFALSHTVYKLPYLQTSFANAE